MWKVLIIGTLASVLVAACQSATTPTVTVSTATPLPADTATATATATPTPTATPIPTSTPGEEISVHGLARTIEDVESTTECNDQFEALGERVSNAIDQVREPYLDVLLAMPSEKAAQRALAGNQAAQVWNPVVEGAGDALERKLSLTADLWQQLISVSFVDFEAQKAAISSIADAYGELADEFEECDATQGVAGYLRAESRLLRVIVE